MKSKLKLSIAILVIVVISIFIIVKTDFASFVMFQFSDKSDMKVSISPIEANVRFVAADPSTVLYLKVNVVDIDGKPIAKAGLKVYADVDAGTIWPDNVYTDASGEAVIKFTPKSVFADMPSAREIPVEIYAELNGSITSDSFKFELIRTPVVMVHGFLSNKKIFENMIEFLTKQDIKCSALDYPSEKGVKTGAVTLDSYLKEKRLEYSRNGILTETFDLIAHSMGGLVTRYYTCSPEYVMHSNVRKIIFISVPQNGSPWAALGEEYYNNQGIRDLIPENNLFTSIFPGMINKGLNHRIQTGSLLGEFDEVVASNSADIKSWNINTEVFNVGENHFTMDNLLSGKLIEASNHKGILSNKKVFKRIKEMLEQNLSYPKRLK